MKNIIVGAGFSGATLANLLASKHEEVEVIEKRPFVAGNCYDYKDDGITVHKYGSHIFHTTNDDIWKFVRRFTDFNQYMHRVLAVIDGIKTTIPFSFRTIYDVFPKSVANRLEKKLLENYPYNQKIPILEFLNQKDEDLNFLASYVYDKVFLYYSSKQWGIAPSKLDGAITSRVPVYLSMDTRYFQDKYQGIPIDGYTETVNRILDHKNISLKLNTDFNEMKKEIINDAQHGHVRLFFSGSVDDFFDYSCGVLPYRSVNFSVEKYKRQYYQENAVINFPFNYDFTRIHEYKYYLNESSDYTIIAKEYSEDFVLGKNDRYYPILSNEASLIYNKYKEKLSNMNNIYVLGRLGAYKYFDIDKTILNAMELFNSL